MLCFLALLMLALLQLHDCTKRLHSFDTILDNPIVRLVRNTYTVFYNYPRKNILYDRPPRFFRNSTKELLLWYQLPRSLPPYRYVGNELLPDGFFCWGLPGNTLPLGDFDPLALHTVAPNVVRKYRESELKHGRIG